MKQTIKDLNKRGIVLLNTLIFTFFFSVFFNFVVTKYQLELSQQTYLEQAVEKQEIELRVMKCVLDPNCYDLSFFMNDSQVEIYFLDTEVTVDVIGKYHFTIMMELDLDNFVIKSYNYDDNIDSLEEDNDISQ